MPRHHMLALLSLLVHAVVLAAIFVAQIFAVGTLPTPRQPLTFNDARFIHLADITLPPTVQHVRHSGAASALETASPANAAPIAAPHGVAPETGNEGAATSAPGVAGLEGRSGELDAIGRVEPPPPPPPPAAPVRLHAGMQPPRKIVDVAPAYPNLARTARVEGVVILEAIIAASGRVESVRVLRSIPMLDQAAVEAVRQWQFTPTLLNGEAVPIVMTVTVNFTMTK